MDRSVRRSFRRRPSQRPPLWARVKEGFRKFTAFMFSNVGIILLVVLYMLAGSVMFTHVEEDQNIKTIMKMKEKRKELVQALWKISCCDVNIFNESIFLDVVDSEIIKYQRDIVRSYKEGWTGGDSDNEDDWSFSNGFLYSLTVITTIGYGHIAPKSDSGKIATIFYAIIGMPLFLLYLSNIGDILAKSFKWIYAKLCLCRMCPGVARRRALRERRKTRDFGPYDRDLAEFQMNHLEAGSSGGGGNGGGGGSSDNYSSVADNQESDHEDNYNIGDGDDDDDDDSSSVAGFDRNSEAVTVPITVSLMIIILYMLIGAYMFSQSEGWNLLDGSYFCFISLSSIGFGDFVPGFQLTTKGGTGNKVNLSAAMCAVYLLLGMALIAMCFTLMQEQVLHKVRSLKKSFGRCFRCCHS